MNANTIKLMNLHCDRVTNAIKENRELSREELLEGIRLLLEINRTLHDNMIQAIAWGMR
jgi:regulator of sigma D